MQTLKEPRIGANEIAVVGVPFDKNSSFRRGPALAPQRIREALFSESSNLWTEQGIDLESQTNWHLQGDIDCTASERTQIQQQIQNLLQQGAKVVSLGGDHSITYPLLQAYAQSYPQLTLIYFDAHPDLYHEFAGNPYSHACPCARIMEAGLAGRLVQIGIRTMTGHQREQADKFGVEVIEMRSIQQLQTLSVEGPFYLSIDLDCLDPAFAPGVSHHEPGGLATRDVLNLIHNLPGTLVGADITEYNPERDYQGVTGMVAGKLLKEILGRMIIETDKAKKES